MIGFIGLSHLGIIYSHATAAKDFEVCCFDPDHGLCSRLSAGQFPVAEPGLEELFQSNRKRIHFSSDSTDLSRCNVLFFSLDVPTDSANRSDLRPLRKLIDEATPHIAPEATVIILCQVPPGFTRALRASLAEKNVPWSANIFCQVETLVFGNAVERALRPERYIIGCAEPQKPPPKPYAAWLKAFDCPVFPMRYESAELTKTAINLFLVSSVATTNTLAELCEHIGADWAEIVPALRLDRRIGPHAYLSPGLGLSGGNLERDLVTIRTLANEHGTEAGIIDAWQLNSIHRRDWVLGKLHDLVLARLPAPRLAIWGLAYKPNTHSMKNSPSLALLEALAPYVKMAYDPQARLETAIPRLELARSALEACHHADALVVMTPWPEFSQIQPAEIKQRMHGNVIIDPFGALDRKACLAHGFDYHQLGGSC